MNVFQESLCRPRERRAGAEFCAGCAYLDKSNCNGIWCEKMVAEVRGVYVEDLAYLGCPRAEVLSKAYVKKKPRR